MDSQPVESMPAPSPWAYAAVVLLLAAAVLGAVARYPGRGGAVLAAAALLGLLATLPGWLFRRKGYTFAEGWFCGLLVWPLAVAFGIWGPASN